MSNPRHTHSGLPVMAYVHVTPLWPQWPQCRCMQLIFLPKRLFESELKIISSYPVYSYLPHLSAGCRPGRPSLVPPSRSGFRLSVHSFSPHMAAQSRIVFSLVIVCVLGDGAAYVRARMRTRECVCVCVCMCACVRASVRPYVPPSLCVCVCVEGWGGADSNTIYT